MSDPRVLARLKNEFVPVLVNVKEEKEWAKSRSVGRLPDVRFVDSESGDDMTTLTGRSVEEVLEAMDDCVELIAEFAGEDDG